ncbi:MAG: DUF4297 domain-containing protein, partial [Proteobacteria bacterium]
MSANVPDDLSSALAITDADPREEVGRKSSNKFEYQFKKAAEAAVELLVDGPANRVFCDYHDDFVVRRHEAGTNVYVFHQVKAKDKKNHLWSFVEIFGVSSHKSFKGDCRVGFAWNMLEHHLSFGKQCKEVLIVTNVSFDDKVADFLEDVASVTKIEELKPHSANQFGLIVKFYGEAKSSLTAELLFTFFKKFQVRSLAGALDDSENSDASVILQRVFEFFASHRRLVAAAASVAGRIQFRLVDFL